MNWTKFFYMGGYGLYVWGSYGVTFLLLIVEVLMLLKRKHNLGKKNGSPLVSRESELEASFQEAP